jgi:hypothetical protein
MLIPWRIFAGHIHDEALRAGLDPSRIAIRHLEGTNLQELDLPTSLNAQIAVIARFAQTDDDLQAVLDDMATMLLKHEAQLLDAKAAAVVPKEPLPADQILAAEKARRAAHRSSKVAS